MYVVSLVKFATCLSFLVHRIDDWNRVDEILAELSDEVHIYSKRQVT